MNIKPIVYETLTPQERVIASIEAMARGDAAERKRLMQSCPQKKYLMADAAYTDKMDVLTNLAIAVECDLRGCALNLFIFWVLDELQQEKKLPFWDSLQNKIPDFLQEMLTIRTAWHEALEEQGINPQTMEEAFYGTTATTILVEGAAQIGVLPDETQKDAYKASLIKILEAGI